MSSSAYKNVHVSPSVRNHTCDSVGVLLSQGGYVAHDQALAVGTELGLMEMSEVEYTHLQHLIQAQMEAHAAPSDGMDARFHPAAMLVKDTTAASTVISPFVSSQAIDLSTSTDEHGALMPGEKTPASFGEVPSFVLARIRDEDSLTELCANSSTSSKRSASSARVCLEKRFNAVSADAPRQQDIQSTVYSNFLTILQQSAEAQEAVMHPQMQKWMKTDRTNPFEISNPFVGSLFNPVANMCEQVFGHIPHIVEARNQGLIIPKSFSFNYQEERIVTQAHHTNGGNSKEAHQLLSKEDDMVTPAATKVHSSSQSPQPITAAKAAPDSAGEAGSSTRKRARSHMSVSQRREKHNSKERERRKRIRSCCDELKTLVPFCDSDTDKVTALQWTTAFLRYINKTYGDNLKEEFEKTFSAEKGLFLKSASSSGQDSIQRVMDETLVIPLAVEQ